MHIYENKELIELLSQLVPHQLKNFFMYDGRVDCYLKETLTRVETCFINNKNKYYRENGELKFSPFHSGQYAIFLWYLSNCVWKYEGDSEFAEKIYYLNKVLHSVDWYYQLELPNTWGVEHPLGSVLGRANYNEFLFLYQGTTIGRVLRDGVEKYPSLGQYVTLNANAKILGESNIGDFVVLAANACVKNQDIPNYSLVFDKSPNLKIVTKTRKKWSITTKINGGFYNERRKEG